MIFSQHPNLENRAAEKPSAPRFFLPIGILPFVVLAVVAIVWLSAGTFQPVYDLPREGHQAFLSSRRWAHGARGTRVFWA